MVDQSGQHRLQNVVQEYLKNEAISLIVKIIGMAIEWILILILGYEVNKLTSNESTDFSILAEFFGVLALCVLIWILKCCCLKRLCNKIIEQAQNADESEPTKPNTGCTKSIVQKLHLILNRVAVAAVGYEIRKRLFAKEPMNNWDYAEVIAVILFCVWIFTIKYCISKCKCLGFCSCCAENHLKPNERDAEAANAPIEPKIDQSNVDRTENTISIN